MAYNERLFLEAIERISMSLKEICSIHSGDDSGSSGDVSALLELQRQITEISLKVDGSPWEASIQSLSSRVDQVEKLGPAVEEMQRQIEELSEKVSKLNNDIEPETKLPSVAWVKGKRYNTDSSVWYKNSKGDWEPYFTIKAIPFDGGVNELHDIGGSVTQQTTKYLGQVDGEGLFHPWYPICTLGELDPLDGLDTRSVGGWGHAWEKPMVICGYIPYGNKEGWYTYEMIENEKLDLRDLGAGSNDKEPEEPPSGGSDEKEPIQYPDIPTPTEVWVKGERYDLDTFQWDMDGDHWVPYFEIASLGLMGRINELHDMGGSVSQQTEKYVGTTQGGIFTPDSEIYTIDDFNSLDEFDTRQVQLTDNAWGKHLVCGYAVKHRTWHDYKIIESMNLELHDNEDGTDN